ncbi:MAG: NAD(P)H-dependent oxidoreductase [Minisyncoccia bacterium]
MNDTIKKAFEWRSAVKVFDTERKVSDSDVRTIIDSARMSPSAYGLQPFRLVEVKDVALRAKLKDDASYGQAQVTDASHLFVVAVRTDMDETFVDEFVARTADIRGVDIAALKGFRDMMVGDIVSRTPENKFAWAGRQAYIALGAMIETAALLGIDAGPMEGFNPSKVDEILGLSEKNLHAVGYLALGYRGDDSYSKSAKVRVSYDNFVIVV